MSLYHTAKRKAHLFDPASGEPFKLSRSKLELFLNCPRCFYLDRRLGIGQPGGLPFTLNSAVDILLKKEFDLHRAKNKAHPLMKTYGIEAVPLAHEKLDLWRNALRGGIGCLHQPTNFLLYGAVDDIWIKANGELIVVDYKATAKSGAITIDADWQIGYRRQLEIYQWLFRRNNYEVSKVGYFVYCNGKTDRSAFDGKLEFAVEIIPYQGDDGWVESALIAAKQCLLINTLPKANPNCDFCNYRQASSRVEKEYSDFKIN